MSLSFLYVDLETSALGRKDGPGKVVLVTYKWLGEGVTPVRQKTIWDLGSEKAVIDALAAETGIYQHKWPALAGFNLEFDIPILEAIGVKFGHLDFGARWRKPRLDVQQVVYFLNADAKKPLCRQCEYMCSHFGECPDGGCSCLNTGRPGSRHDGQPAMFYGAKLSRYSAKTGSGTDVPGLYDSGRYDDIARYARDECLAYEDLFNTLCDEGPKWWSETLKPRLRL